MIDSLSQKANHDKVNYHSLILWCQKHHINDGFMLICERDKILLKILLIRVLFAKFKELMLINDIGLL